MRSRPASGAATGRRGAAQDTRCRAQAQAPTTQGRRGHGTSGDCVGARQSAICSELGAGRAHRGEARSRCCAGGVAGAGRAAFRKSEPRACTRPANCPGPARCSRHQVRTLRAVPPSAASHGGLERHAGVAVLQVRGGPHASHCHARFPRVFELAGAAGAARARADVNRQAARRWRVRRYPCQRGPAKRRGGCTGCAGGTEAATQRCRESGSAGAVQSCGQTRAVAARAEAAAAGREHSQRAGAYSRCRRGDAELSYTAARLRRRRLLVTTGS